MPGLKDGLLRYFSKEQLNKISDACIFIAGCGGLGSNAAHFLVRSGFLHFTLLDFDSVEASNLNRQFYFPDQTGMPKTKALSQNLLRLEPDLDIRILDQKINSDTDFSTLFDDNDIVIEAFDSPESKALLVSSALRMKKHVISASGIAGIGDTDKITVKRPFPQFYIVGDDHTGLDKAAPYAPRVNVAAAKQADIVLELVLGDDYRS